MNATLSMFPFHRQRHVRLLYGGLTLAIVVGISQHVAAQVDGDNVERPPVMATRVFSVADLILPAPDYSFQGIDLSVGTGGRTRFGPAAGSAFGGVGGSGMGGYGGGGFGGSGAGFFQIGEYGGGGLGGGQMPGMAGGPAPQPQPQAAARRFGMDSLTDVIYTTIEPGSWDVVGGEGSIAPLGTMLVVRQRPEVIKQVAELLDRIRETGGTLQSVTIRADWLLLEPGQLAEITAGEGGAISREAVRRLTATSGASGQITCFDGQTVHIVAGKLQTSVTSAIPVVGQNSPQERTPEQGRLELPPHVLAQQSADGAGEGGFGGAQPGGYPGGMGGVPGAFTNGGSVGYQPVMQTTNFGALLQVTPTVGPGGKSIVLDLRSLVARPADQPGQPVNFRGVVPLDRLNVTVQQFMTTLHLPVGQPTLIAGSTLQPFAQGEEAKQLYLVVEATLAPRP